MVDMSRVLCFLILSVYCSHSTSIWGQTDQPRAIGKYDWSGFLGPERNSKSPEIGILKDWSGGKLKTEWTTEVGDGYVLGSVADDKFYQFDAVEKTCRLICRDAATGDEHWRFEYPFEYVDMYGFEAGPRATPVIDDGRVYIFGVEGRLHCLDTNDGKEIWSRNVNEEFGVVQNFFGVGSTPLVHEQLLVVMVGGSERRDADPKDLSSVKPNGTAVIAFDKRTGEKKYALGNDLSSYSSIQSYRDNGKVMGVAWLRTNAIGFDLRNGEELWSFPFRARKYESVNAATPVVRGNQILLTESYGPGAVLLNVAENQVKTVWRDRNIRSRSMASHWSTPVRHDGHFYGCHGENRSSAELRCVEWATGDVKWRKRGFGRSSLTFVDDHLVVLDEVGELVLIKAEPNAYSEVTRYSDTGGKRLSINYPCWSAPIVCNGRLYVRGKNKLVCLRVKNR